MSMDPPPVKKFSELFGLVKSWLPWRSEPSNVSRDFWMPDQFCRVCYECDAQFTIFNRKHHCRLCGRVFCAKCTENSVPAPSSDARTSREDRERIRVCNYCFKQWEQGLVSFENGNQISSLYLSPSLSETSLISTRSTVTGNSTTASFASAPSQRLHGSGVGPYQPSFMEADKDQQAVATSERSQDTSVYSAEPSPNQYRSDDEDEYYYDLYHYDSETSQFPEDNDNYGHDNFDAMSNGYESQKVYSDGENAEGKSSEGSHLQNSLDLQNVEQIQELERMDDELDTGDDCTTATSMYAAQDVEAEPVDFENNGLLWLPPEPEDEEDGRENDLLDDDDEGDGMREWGSLRSSGSFESGEYRNRERSIEEHKNVIKNVVDGHFRALVAQLLLVENLPVGEEGDEEGWLEIVTSLSWEAATLLKPDTSKSGGMDPGGYVKVKCLASGKPYESMVVKGVVCKKNVAHRRMTSKIEKARLLILGGALEYQRVTNHLSSFDTLLQQEIDHLKMAVAKIDAHHPNVLLVEKSVSRYAQEYLLAKDISLVLNIKRPLLERIARCTGAHIVPSVDHLSSPTLGYCDTFHVDKILEEHGLSGASGKKLVKTLMFFEGCPKPLGCTILLRGASEDDLKKVKHVVQYGVFAAYHLALETSFLADEGASLPEFPMSSPITVALPDKASSIVRSISTVPGFSLSTDRTPPGSQLYGEPLRSLSVPASVLTSSINSALVQVKGEAPLPSIPDSAYSQPTHPKETLPSSTTSISFNHSDQTEDSYHMDDTVSKKIKEKQEIVSKLSLEVNFSAADKRILSGGGPLDAVADNFAMAATSNNVSIDISQQLHNSEGVLLSQGSREYSDEIGFLKEEFPPSPADHQSILVSLSSRCIWKGTVCERLHLLRIKYYGSFDMPLGRFLRDHLFDQNFRCRSCNMPSEAHVHCYTHRQGTLTISVKSLPEFLLPGEKEGKIWMWHRCLRCPRTDGFPPATRRVVMSDAAWSLSFGKFLELSFSNHAAASRVASCGHSLHRDCLRFYGFGEMVACFRYASINVHSVYLPPATLDFNSDSQEFIRKETDEVVNRAELLFSEVLNALGQISERRSGMKTPESRCLIAELEEMLQKEKAEFEELLRKTLNSEAKNGQPAVDILEINRLRRQLIFQSYMWDHRLIHVASVDNNSFQDGYSAYDDRSLPTDSKLADLKLPVNPSEGFSNRDTSLGDIGMNKTLNEGQKPASLEQSDALLQQLDLNLDINCGIESQVPSDQTSPLEYGLSMQRAFSEGQIPLVTNLSDSLDAAWTGENHSGTLLPTLSLNDRSAHNSSTTVATVEGLNIEDPAETRGGLKPMQYVSPKFPTKGSDNMGDYIGWFKMPFYNFYCLLNKNFLGSAQKFDALGEYRPVYISPFLDRELQGGGRLLLPVGINDTVIPVFDDEPTSIISYALMSTEYHAQVCDEGERPKDSSEVVSHFMASNSVHSRSFYSSNDMIYDPHRSMSSLEVGHLSMSGSRSSLSDPLSYSKALHAKVTFTDDSPDDKVKYSVTCYYAKRFEALRNISCPSELDYVRSLSRCKKWGAQGGKSGVFFAKTLDDRFIVKQVTKTELESFIKFGPEYFKYISESIRTCSPTCLAKILGIYQVTAKHVKGGKETKIDVLVMENLLFKRTVTRLYDLKGSSRSRYNPDASGCNKVLLDQNLIEAMPTSPIFVGNKAKRLLDRAVWNDTSFLASVDVMDYSLLVGIDEKTHELVLGIIDFMRQYTWDKHLETWVKASGILGGPKNASPTVISPKQYKKRFRKAMTTYFLMVPDQWSPLIILPTQTPPDS